MSKPVAVRVADLVMDFNVYPRHHLDSTHVGHIVDAYESGSELPPVIVDKKSSRLVDGFHRATGRKRMHGDDATIMVIYKTYPSEKELFLDAVRMNAGHGRKIDSFDRVRCAKIGERLKIDGVDLAASLKITVDKLATLVVNRTATAVGKGNLTTKIELKNTIRHMAGKKLNKRQQEANAKLGGMSPTFYINQVIELLEANLLDPENEKAVERLAVLGGLIDKHLAATA